MEFGWTVEQVRLRDEARAFAHDAVSRFGRANDSWINGFSREVSRELGARGWIGMGWPKQYGGGERPPLDLVWAEVHRSVDLPRLAAMGRMAYSRLGERNERGA